MVGNWKYSQLFWKLLENVQVKSYKQRLIISDYIYDLYPLFVDGRGMQSTHSEFHLSFCFVGGGTLENGVGLGLISIVRTLLFNALF